MTVAPQEGGVVAPYDPNTAGLEDVDSSDVSIPRLGINHKEGKFSDSQGNVEYDYLDCIILGLTKQRVFWRPTGPGQALDDGEKPMCKSTDFEHGFPLLGDDVPVNRQFPWARTSFAPADYPEQPAFNGHVTLPCGACPLKEWGADRTPPLCSEQHTYALLYTPDNGATWLPGILTLQKTGIKPSKSYISFFHSNRTPMFTVMTRITLDVVTKGSVIYSVPKFQRGEATLREMWGDYAVQATQIREFLRQPPRPKEDFDPYAAAEEGTVVESEPVAPAAPAPVVTESAPAAPPPPPATPAPAAPPPPPAAPAAATPPPVPPAPPAAPAPAAAPAAAAPDDDDLPF